MFETSQPDGISIADKQCAGPDCDRNAEVDSDFGLLCNAHHQRVRIHDDPRFDVSLRTVRPAPAVCIEDDCERLAAKRSRCNRHYVRFRHSTEFTRIRVPGLHDLTGKTFGLWTVIERADDQSGLPYWRCLCKCGTVKDIRGFSLTSGQSHSCGCQIGPLATRRNYARAAAGEYGKKASA